jgi:hypothetical protein
VVSKGALELQILLKLTDESGLTVVKLLQAFKRYLKLEWIQEARWIVEDNLSFQEQSQGRAGQGRVRH